MRTSSLLLASATLVGCGRLGFDPHGAGQDASGDASDADADAMDPVACAASMLVCDSFEAGFGAVGWNRSTVSGAIDIDSSHAHRGTSSVHFRTNPIASATASPHARLSTGRGLPITGTLHARVWMYVASPHPTGEFDQLINFADIAGNGISLGTRNGTLVSNDYTHANYAESATAALPLDRWACLQLVIPSGTAGTTRVFVDDTEIADLALPKTEVQPAPARLEVGIQWVGSVSGLPATDLWLDDLLVDVVPLTCSQ